MDEDKEMNALTRKLARLLFVGTLSMQFLPAMAEVNDFACGPLRNAYGPYDYRSDKDKLGIVEGAHLTPDIINLRGRHGGSLGRDIDYTLRAFPNHPQALMTMVKYGERSKTSRPSGATYSVECYLQRAIRFRDDDAMVKMIYAIYLAKNGRASEALTQLNAAADLGADSANLQYNIGLVYFDMKQFDKALQHAHSAYRQGFPLPGLRDKLKRAGKWKDIPPKK
jgi:tetratricopeptide (TPR) repeat protein